MRSLFLKIFLWIWIAMVLVSLTLFLSSLKGESDSELQRDEEIDRTMTPMVAARLAELYDNEGAVAFSAFLNRSRDSFPWRPFLFDSVGHDMLGRHVSAQVMQAFRLAVAQPETQVLNSGDKRWVGQRVVTDKGHQYVLVLEFVAPRPPAFLAAPSLVQLFRLAAIVLIVGLISLWLTRHITSPILKLRDTANQLASGNLSARVGEISPGRKDELAGLSQDFDHMADRIETLMASQQRLLSDISHELRSPLARLSVALGLANRSASPESLPALARIEREAERLNELIGGLLNLARLETGNGLFTRGNVELEPLVQEIVSDANFEAGSRNRTARLISSFPCMVNGNSDLLRSAIENVVRNAVNYTAEGSVVEVSLTSEEQGKTALIAVRDHGPGVPEPALATIFQPFYRVDEARDRLSGGIGLGLSITERAVRGQGGTVLARNAPGAGLFIEIRLPTQVSL
jgi:two-component system, OmpR family, sensor histidine kinase CpxA